MYIKGQGVKQDYAEAKTWFLKAAEAGEADAMYFLGVMYEGGEGGKKDLEKAKKWYRKAVDAGFEEATADLERMR